MPPSERERALKSAATALRQGRIDAAIAEYQKVIQTHPRDWNTANALGDLHVRAGQLDLGITQFTRIADHLEAEGFHPKAAALFKKILKLRPNDEHALLRSGEIAAKLGTFADAKQFFQTVADRRRKRGDQKGAAEMHVKLGTLDPEDLEARLRAARAAVELGDNAIALHEFREVASRLQRQDRLADALPALQSAFDLDDSDEGIRNRLFTAYVDGGLLDSARRVARKPAELKRVALGLEAAGKADDALAVLEDVVAVDPEDSDARGRLAEAYASRGDLARAREWLSPESAGANAPLWMTLGEVELRAGRHDEGRRAIAQALSLDRQKSTAVAALGLRLAGTSPDAGFQCVDAVVDIEMLTGSHQGAAARLIEFVDVARYHLVALLRLVAICVDGGLEDVMSEAQQRLAEAYLHLGRGLEARIISEDLLARDPKSSANVERYRRALVMTGENDPDAVIADRLSGDSPFFASDFLDLNDGTSFDASPAAEPVEANAPTPAGTSEVVPPEARSLTQVFHGLRDEVTRRSEEEEAAEQYLLAQTYREMGMIEDAAKSLEHASRSPRHRFEAASMLGQMHLEQRNFKQAIEWLERAAEAPPPTPDAGRALFYDLAGALESVGEEGRALAILLELQSGSRGYRDLTARIDRLSKAQTRG
ncbi:MAG: tetratricopeptide repeat protein [Vicinamibacterales bacterium]